MIRPRPIIALLALSASLCLPGMATAQTTDSESLAHSQPSSASDQDRADELFLQGKAAAQAKNWDEAHQLLQEAWALKQSYDIASNLGQVAYLLGKHAEAAQHVSFALRHYPATGDAEQKQKAKDLLDMVRQKVSSLSVQVTPPEAEVFVDGTSAGRASALPPELFVEPGERTVIARLEGEAVERHVSAKPGGQYKLDLALAASTPAAVPVAAEPEPASHSPSEPTDTAPSGFQNKHIAVIVGGVLTVGSGVALGIYASKRSKAKSDIETYQARVEDESSDPNACAHSNSAACQDLAEARDDWETSGRAINVLLPTTIVLFGATAAVATYVFWPSDSDESSGTALTPVLTPEQQGLLLSGSF